MEKRARAAPPLEAGTSEAVQKKKDSEARAAEEGAALRAKIAALEEQLEAEKTTSAELLQAEKTTSAELRAELLKCKEGFKGYEKRREDEVDKLFSLLEMYFAADDDEIIKRVETFIEKTKKMREKQKIEAPTPLRR